MNGHVLRHICVCVCMIPGFQGSSQAQSGPSQAEYVMRWEPLTVAPATAEAVLRIFKQKGLPSEVAKQEKFVIAYQAIGRPPVASPAQVKVIGRKRVEWDEDDKAWGGKLIVKYRGPQSFALPGFQCPFTNSTPEDEVDISFIFAETNADGKGQLITKDAYSITCESKKETVHSLDELKFPPSLHAVEKCPTKISMERVTTKDKVKIEMWHLPAGGLLEISKKSPRGDLAEASFRLYVEALVNSGAVPIERSKSEAGEDCDTGCPH